QLGYEAIARGNAHAARARSEPGSRLLALACQTGGSGRGDRISCLSVTAFGAERKEMTSLNGLPLTALKQSFARRLSNGKVCPKRALGFEHSLHGLSRVPSVRLYSEASRGGDRPVTSSFYKTASSRKNCA